MKEVVIENDLDLNIYINNIPNLSFISEDEISLLASELDLTICTMLEKKDKRRKYYKGVDKKEPP